MDCYGYPTDLIVLLFGSLVFNGILCISLMRRIAEHEADKKTLESIRRTMKKAGWTV